MHHDFRELARLVHSHVRKVVHFHVALFLQPPLVFLPEVLHAVVRELGLRGHVVFVRE